MKKGWGEEWALFMIMGLYIESWLLLLFLISLPFLKLYVKFAMEKPLISHIWVSLMRQSSFPDSRPGPGYSEPCILLWQWLVQEWAHEGQQDSILRTLSLFFCSEKA